MNPAKTPALHPTPMVRADRASAVLHPARPMMTSPIAGPMLPMLLKIFLTEMVDQLPELIILSAM